MLSDLWGKELLKRFMRDSLTHRLLCVADLRKVAYQFASWSTRRLMGRPPKGDRVHVKIGCTPPVEEAIKLGYRGMGYPPYKAGGKHAS